MLYHITTTTNQLSNPFYVYNCNDMMVSIILPHVIVHRRGYRTGYWNSKTYFLSYRPKNMNFIFHCRQTLVVNKFFFLFMMVMFCPNLLWCFWLHTIGQMALYKSEDMDGILNGMSLVSFVKCCEIWI